LKCPVYTRPGPDRLTAAGRLEGSADDGVQGGRCCGFHCLSCILDAVAFGPRPRRCCHPARYLASRTDEGTCHDHRQGALDPTLCRLVDEGSRARYILYHFWYKGGSLAGKGVWALVRPVGGWCVWHGPSWATVLCPHDLVLPRHPTPPCCAFLHPLLPHSTCALPPRYAARRTHLMASSLLPCYHQTGQVPVVFTSRLIGGGWNLSGASIPCISI